MPVCLLTATTLCILLLTAAVTAYPVYSYHSPYDDTPTIDVFVTANTDYEYPQKIYSSNGHDNYGKKYLITSYGKQHIDIEALLQNFLKSHKVYKKQLHGNERYNEKYSTRIYSPNTSQLYQDEPHDDWAYGGVSSADPGIGKPEKNENSLDVYDTNGRKI